MRGARAPFALALATVLAACAADPAPQPVFFGPGQVAGTVTYLDRASLAPGSKVSVWLVARTTAAPGRDQIIAAQEIRTEGQQVPIPFVLDYDRGRLEPCCFYGVAAEIDDGGRRIFASRAPKPVHLIDPDVDNVAVVVDPAP